MNIMDKLQAVENKFLELESLISDPSVLEDMNKWQRYNREHSSMQPIIEAYREYKTVCQGIEDNKEMLKAAEQKIKEEAGAKYFKKDHTHTSKLGAQMNAQSFAKGLRENKSELAKYLKK